MSGTNFEFNIAKGSIIEKCRDNPALFTALVLINTSLESDALLKDYDSVQAILAGASIEATTGYARKTGITAAEAINDTTDKGELDVPDQVFSAVTAGETWAKLILAYQDGAGDANLIPLLAFSFDVVPDGNDITADFTTNQPIFTAT